LNNIIVSFLTVAFSCCSNQIADYDQLKLEGYIEVACNTFDTYKKNRVSYIEFNKHFDYEYTFLIGRCLDKVNCSFSISKEDKITCQRYSYDEEAEDKRDYLSSAFKEFADHKVLYLEL
jgi:hypothetical protein